MDQNIGPGIKVYKIPRKSVQIWKGLTGFSRLSVALYGEIHYLLTSEAWILSEVCKASINGLCIILLLSSVNHLIT